MDFARCTVDDHALFIPTDNIAGITRGPETYVIHLKHEIVGCGTQVRLDRADDRAFLERYVLTSLIRTA